MATFKVSRLCSYLAERNLAMELGACLNIITGGNRVCSHSHASKRGGLAVRRGDQATRARGGSRGESSAGFSGGPEYQELQQEIVTLTEELQKQFIATASTTRQNHNSLRPLQEVYYGLWKSSCGYYQ